MGKLHGNFISFSGHIIPSFSLFNMFHPRFFLRSPVTPNFLQKLEAQRFFFQLVECNIFSSLSNSTPRSAIVLQYTAKQMHGKEVLQSGKHLQRVTVHSDPGLLQGRWIVIPAIDMVLLRSFICGRPGVNTAGFQVLKSQL